MADKVSEECWTNPWVSNCTSFLLKGFGQHKYLSLITEGMKVVLSERIGSTDRSTLRCLMKISLPRSLHKQEKCIRGRDVSELGVR